MQVNYLDINNEFYGSFNYSYETSKLIVTRRCISSKNKVVRIQFVASDKDSRYFYIYDQNQNLYKFDLDAQRFYHLATLNIALSCFAVDFHSPSNLLLAMTDNSFCSLSLTDLNYKVFESEHETNINQIDQNLFKYQCVTTSSDCITLWDLSKKMKERNISLNQIPSNSNRVIKFLCSRFLPPNGEKLLTCMRNGSIYLWNISTYQCLFHLELEDYPKISYRTISMTEDGNFLFAGGQIQVIHVWSLLQYSPNKSTFESMPNDEIYGPHLMEVIRLKNSIKSAKKLCWLPKFVKDDKINQSPLNCGALSFLSSDGRVYVLIRIESFLETKVLKSQLEETKLICESESNYPSKRVFWSCIRVISLGNDLIWNIFTNFISDKEDDFTDRPYLLYLIDWNGSLILNNLRTTRPKQQKLSNTPLVECMMDSSSIKPSERAKKVKVKSRFASVKPRYLQQTCKITSKVNKKVPLFNIEQLDDIIDLKKLRKLLRTFYQFPEKYRGLIWSLILRLPKNSTSFKNLQSKGIHLAFETLPEKYPIKNFKIMKQLQNICSALAHWTNIFGEVDYLPLLTFPFIKVFPNQPLECFELLATILCNWCGSWFEYFPNPPINVLCLIENILAFSDKELYAHFVNIGLTTETYAWTLLQTAMSEVLSQEEWLILWDNLICYHPCFLLFAVAAYSLINRSRLLSIKDMKVLENFYMNLGSINIRQLIDRIHDLNANTPKNIHPRIFLDALNKESSETIQDHHGKQKKLPFVPLSKGYYPIVGKYPKFIIDFQLKERERIREAEKDYYNQKKIAENLATETRIKSTELQNWMRQQELISKAETQRHKMIKEEEQKLTEQRKKLNAFVRELKYRQLDMMEKSNMKIKELDLNQRKEELKKMEEHLENIKRTKTEEYELCEQLAEISILNRQCERKEKDNIKDIKNLRMELPPIPRPDQEFGNTETTITDISQIKTKENTRFEPTGHEYEQSLKENEDKISWCFNKISDGQIKADLENCSISIESRPDSVATGEAMESICDNTISFLTSDTRPF